MSEWGMTKGTDYNLTDVIVAEEVSGRRKKTRAYDFVLPYQVPEWEHSIFVQCQFYAGDSGSVSHKNGDQTSSSRQKVSEKHDSPMFIEYVDGAGYFSSLNGDLKSLFSMEDTSSFIQIRTAPIRLRRALQEIGFLTQLEIEQAIFRTNGTIGEVKSLLASEGYKEKEIERSLNTSLHNNGLSHNNDNLVIQDARNEIVRRYILLDTVACYGDIPSGKPTGSLLVPGYGPFYGMKLDDLANKAVELAPSLQDQWVGNMVLKDIRWLCDQGMAMS